MFSRFIIVLCAILFLYDNIHASNDIDTLNELNNILNNNDKKNTKTHDVAIKSESSKDDGLNDLLSIIDGNQAKKDESNDNSNSSIDDILNGIEEEILDDKKILANIKNEIKNFDLKKIDVIIEREDERNESEYVVERDELFDQIDAEVVRLKKNKGYSVSSLKKIEDYHEDEYVVEHSEMFYKKDKISEDIKKYDDLRKIESDNETKNSEYVVIKASESKDNNSSHGDGLSELLGEIDEAVNKYDFKKLDPNEKTNKAIYSLNMFLFRNTILPFMYVIDAWVPKFITKGYRNFNKNMLEPRNIIVHLMRKDKERAKLAAKRFFFNTIFGALGMIEVEGLRHKNYSKIMTFDCTARKYKSGKYVIMPFTNQYYQREYTTQTFDWFTNPVIYINFPFNYLIYTIDQAISMIPNKELLYKSRLYSDLNYKNLRDYESDQVFNDVNCVG